MSLQWRWLRPLTPVAGGLALVLGQRVLPGQAVVPWLNGLALGLLVLGVVWSGWFPSGRPLDGASGQWRLALPSALWLAGALLYFAEGALVESGPGPVDWWALARWGWILCWLQGAVLFVFVELAWNAQGENSGPDPTRLGRALLAGNGLGLLLLLVVTLNFVFERQPWEWNLAYFKVTRPSQATLEVVSGLSEPIEGVAFFTTGNTVLSLLRPYFRAVREAAPEGRLQLKIADAELQPGLADRYQARGNGWVLLKKGELVVRINVGEQVERARPALLKFDENFFSRIQEVARPRQVVYLTVGHGERNEPAREGRNPDRNLNAFQTLLRQRNFEPKPLGWREGLGRDVPADAAAVVVAAPTEPFQAAEIASLREYLRRGGRLLALLEPKRPKAAQRVPSPLATPADELLRLLGEFGIGYNPVVQGNDRIFGRRTFTPADHALLVSISFRGHGAVRQLQAGGRQNPLLFLDAGALRSGRAPRGWKVTEIVKAMPGTWGDRNGNFRFDAGRETRGQPALAIAAEKLPEKGQPPGQAAGGRIVAYADTDIASDLLLRNRANRIALAQAMDWLVGQPSLAAYPESEADVRLLHAKNDDWLWFYVPVMGIPALVLGAGLWRVRRLRLPEGRNDG